MKLPIVTLFGLDPDADANPLWHTAFSLSYYDEETKKMIVLGLWGFGGVPATSHFSLLRKIKNGLGLDTDFYGNHGMLSEEEMRRLEKGCGLHGVSFEVTEENFNLLQQRCINMIEDQTNAINEAARDLNLKPSEGKVRNYALENDSRRIYEYELKKAKEEKRTPRLHEFSLSPLPNAHTCKTQALQLLDGIITPKQLERIKGSHPGVTRLSGKMEKIYLHSVGPLHEHKKSSGKIVHFRKNKEAKLYWSLPPQEIETLSPETNNLLKLPHDQCQEVKKMIHTLQTLEWYFINWSLPTPFCKNQRDQLVNHIANLYQAFAIIEPKELQVSNYNTAHFWQKNKTDTDDKLTTKKMNDCHQFLNTIYELIEDKKESKNNYSEVDKTIEVVTSLLNYAQKKNICKIIGKKHLSQEEKLITIPLKKA